MDADHIFGTRFRYDASTGEIQSIVRLPAGYGKVAVLEELRETLQISHERIVYVGDGSSDIHVMLHLNRLDGLTIAVSENKYITQIARRTVLGEDALACWCRFSKKCSAGRVRAYDSFSRSNGFCAA